MRVRFFWSELSSLLLDAPCSSIALRRAIRDVLYRTHAVAIFPKSGVETVGRRPPPDLWDDECYDVMVGRNAAWRRWCRECTAEAQQTSRAKRLHFHHLVRKKPHFRHLWLRVQESLAVSHPARRDAGGALFPSRSSSPSPVLRLAAPGQLLHSRGGVTALPWTVSSTLQQTKGPVACRCGPKPGPSQSTQSCRHKKKSAEKQFK